MFYWVCVNDKPVALPTASAESAKQLALEQIRSDSSARVQIDVYGESKPSSKLRYDARSRQWVMSDALAP
jgi:hypothetical protein